MITAGMATIKSREENARRVMEDLLPQVDRLHIHFDKGYKRVPSWAKADNVTTTHGNSAGDAGKFFGKQEGYYVTVDDDLFYPEDFIDRTIDAIREHGCAVSWGGKVMNDPPITSYYIGGWIAAYPIIRGFAEDIAIDIPLTCGFGYDTEQITFAPTDFEHPNMADIWAGIKCRNEGLKIIAIAHEGIDHQSIDFSKTIYSTSVKADRIQTKVFNERW